MRRACPFIGACLLLAMAAVPVYAQQRLFSRSATEVVELDPRPATLGAVRRRFPIPAGTFARDTAPLLGGRLLIWVGTGPGAVPRVTWLDTSTGTTQGIDLPGFSPTRVLGTDGNTRVAVLGTRTTGGQAVLTGDIRTASTSMVDVGPWFPTAPLAYAGVADLLFVGRSRGIGPDTNLDIDVIQASTGTVLRTLDISPVSADLLAADAVGTRLYVTDAANGTFAFDVATGARVAENTTDPSLKSSIVPPSLDEPGGRVITSISPGNSGFGDAVGIAAFAAGSLQFLGRVQVPEQPLPAPTSDTWPSLTQEVDVTGMSATALVLQAVTLTTKYGAGPVGCLESQLIALDAATGRLRQTVDTTEALGGGACLADLIRLTEPPAPRSGSANVAGHRVTLQWEAVFGATQYDVEAGSATGRADLARITVNEPRLVVEGVPRGVYYLRVRAINTVGLSAPSGEVRLIVP